MPDARAEVDDLDRDAAADAIQAADALLDRRGLPGQVVEHQAVAELEVAALAAGFGRDEQARPVGGAEPRDLGVAPRRRELLVEDAAGELRPRAERRRAASRASRDGRRRPASSRAPRRQRARLRRAARPGADRSRSIASGLLPQLRSRPARAPPSAPRPEASARRMRSMRPPSRHRIVGARLRRRSACLDCAVASVPPPDAIGRQIDRRPARGAAGRRCPTRRVELVHGGSGTPRREPRLDVRALGKLVRPQQLQQPEEAVRIVFERRRAEQQDVPAERRDRRDGAIRRLARMSGRPPQPLRLVDDQQIDARGDRLRRSARGRSTSVSSAITARRWTSNGLKPAPKSCATSARRGGSSSVNTWWYLRHSSPSHCTVSASGRDDQAALDRCRCAAAGS